VRRRFSFCRETDWLEFLKGFIIPQPLAYPDWAVFAAGTGAPAGVGRNDHLCRRHRRFGYDYLAYVSYLRDKHWGQAGRAIATRLNSPTRPRPLAHQSPLAARGGCGLGDELFRGADFQRRFVACGAVILGPQHRIPAGSNLLALQAEFVTPIYPWLKHVYFAGAFLTIFGTLYAPSKLRRPCCANWSTHLIRITPCATRSGCEESR